MGFLPYVKSDRVCLLYCGFFAFTVGFLLVLWVFCLYCGFFACVVYCGLFACTVGFMPVILIVLFRGFTAYLIRLIFTVH